jgi:hypothetical protein
MSWKRPCDDCSKQQGDWGAAAAYLDCWAAAQQVEVNEYGCMFCHPQTIMCLLNVCNESNAPCPGDVNGLDTQQHSYVRSWLCLLANLLAVLLDLKKLKTKQKTMF